MPQLDLYNFFIIIFFSIIGLLLIFSYFQKYWLYSWKLLTIINNKIKNLQNVSNLFIKNIYLMLFYTFIFFNNIIFLFVIFQLYNLLGQKNLFFDYTFIINTNNLKNF